MGHGIELSQRFQNGFKYMFFRGMFTPFKECYQKKGFREVSVHIPFWKVKKCSVFET